MSEERAAKPKRTVSEETKRAMAEGRRKAREARQAVAAEQTPEDIIRGQGPLHRHEIVYGGDSEPEPVVEPEDNSPFALFIAALDDETKELVPESELRAIFDEQVAKAKAEKRAQKRKAAAQIAVTAAQMEAGLIPLATQEMMALQKRNGQQVRWRLELPPCGPNGEVPDIGLRIDGKIYLDNREHTLTLAQYESYREMVYRCSQMELAFQGQNTRQRSWLLGRTSQANESRYHIELT